MRKFATGNSGADTSADNSESSKGSESWLKVHKCGVLLVVIMILALVMRVVFSYGISAGDNYALSGGSNASSHLRIVLEILSGTYNPSSQIQLNYPIGIESVSGPLYDYVMAAIAMVVSACGVTNSVAASGTLAWSTPIIAVLTAIPVFMLAKKVTGDSTVALLSAFIYEFTALVISVTPFSYGAEYAMIGFLASFMGYFLACAVKAADDSNASGLGAAKSKGILVPAILAGVFFGLLALTWSEFRIVVIATAVVLGIHLVISRISGRDMGAATGIATVFLLVGTAIAAAYYVPFGLWSAVFSGACVLAVLTVVYALAFNAVAKKSWVVTIPVFAVIIIAVAAVIAIVMPSLSNAMLNGNNIYEPGLVTQFSETFSRSSISSMAAWFGWVTVWFPLFVGGYMLYRYRRDGGKRLYDLAVFGMLTLFILCWFATSYAIFAAPVMAIGAAYLIVEVFRLVDVRGYLASLKTLRGSGYKGAAKKIFNFFPFVTVVVTALLVVAPNAIYSFDAATPTNNEGNDYFGGLGYSITTSDGSLTSTLWNSYTSVDKDGAIITYYGNADAAASYGGFDVVTSSYGNGAAAMTTAYLHNGSSGALVSMIVRLLSQDTSKVADAVTQSGLTSIEASVLKKILDDPAYAEKYYVAGSSFAGLTLDDGLRVYYGAYSYLVDTSTSAEVIKLSLSDADLCTFYDAVMKVTGKAISYIEVDSTMLPIYYGDGSSASTIAALGGYSLDSYGAASNFFSYSSYLSYYALYNESMYSSLIYRALVGITPSEAGYNYVPYLYSALALSDGTVKAVPGTGLTGFVVDKWYVMYNADSKATGSSSGWTTMDGYEAITKQNAEGGLINYLASAVVLKYVGASATSASYTTLSGDITFDGSTPGNGVTVNVYSVVDYDSSGTTSEVLISTSVSDGVGHYSVAVPKSGDYYVVYSTSASYLADGNVICTDKNTSGVVNKNFASSSVDGYLVDANSSLYSVDGYLNLTRSGSSTPDYVLTVTEGKFSTATAGFLIVPGTYSASVTDHAGNVVASATLTIVSGDVKDLTVSVSTYSMKITVTDYYTNAVKEGVEVVVYDNSTGKTVATVATDAEGIAAFSLPAGTYGYYAGNCISVNTTTKTISSSAVTGTLTVYGQKEITLSGVPAGTAVTVMSQSYRTVTSGLTVRVPLTYDLDGTYFAYAVVDGTLYTGSGIDSIALAATPAKTVSGTVTYNDKAVSSATVVFDAAGFYYQVTADKDGKYSALVPTGLDYVVYAFNSAYAVKYTKVAALAEDKIVDFVLAAGTNAYLTMYYYTGTSTATRTVNFIDNFAAEVTVASGETYTLHNLMTNASGRVVIPIPTADSARSIKLTVEPVSASDYFFIGKDVSSPKAIERTYTSSATFYIQRVAPTSTSSSYGDSYMKTVRVQMDSAYSGKMTAYSSSTTTYDVVSGVVNNGEPVVPGQYTFLMDGALYYNGKVYVTPGDNGVKDVVFDSEPYTCAKITVTTGENDTLKVTTKAKYDETEENSTTTVYHVETGFPVLFTATDKDGKVAYAYYDSTVEASYDLTGKSETVTVTGNIGIPKATGTLTAVFDGKKVSADIKDGSYSIVLPRATAVTFEVSDVKYEGTDKTVEYAAAASASTTTADKAEMTFNVPVVAGTTTPADSAVSVVTASMVDGKAAVTVKLTYDGDYSGITYLVDGSGLLVLDQTYSVYVAKGVSETVVVSGIYNAVLAGAGSDDVAVSVSTVSGTSVASVAIPAQYYTAGTGGEITLTVAKDNGDSKAYDSVNGYSYRYALQFENKNTYAVSVTVTASMTATAGWSLFVSDSDSVVVTSAPYTFTVNGKSTETYYLVAFSETGVVVADVPEVTYSATAVTLEGGSVTVAGDSAGTLAHKSVNVEQESGTVENADTSPAEFKPITYGLLIVSVLLILVLAWAAIRRR